LQVGDPDGRLQPTKRALAIGGAIAFGSSASFGLRRKWFGFFLVAAGLLAFWRWPTLGWHARDVVLALLGAAFLSAYVIQALWARSLLHTGYGAQGTVVKVEVDMGDSDTRTTYKPVVQFTTADGRKVVFTGSIGIGPAPRWKARCRSDTAPTIRTRPRLTGSRRGSRRPSLGSRGGGVVRRRGHRVPPPVSGVGRFAASDGTETDLYGALTASLLALRQMRRI
jgi:hypothetical protein